MLISLFWPLKIRARNKWGWNRSPLSWYKCFFPPVLSFMAAEVAFQLLFITSLILRAKLPQFRSLPEDVSINMKVNQAAWWVAPFPNLLVYDRSGLAQWKEDFCYSSLIMSNLFLTPAFVPSLSSKVRLLIFFYIYFSFTFDRTQNLSRIVIVTKCK